MVAFNTQLSEKSMLALQNHLGRDVAQEIALLIGGPGDAVDITSEGIGAEATPGFDNGPAIMRAIKKAVQTGTRMVFIPAGEFEIHQNNVLHPVTAGVATAFGIRFIGASMNYSILKLVKKEGETRWFYDANNSPGWNRCQFEHIWFQSDQSSYVMADIQDTNGFRLWATTASGGVDKGFSFMHCRHERLGTPLECIGTSNTDSFNAYSCWWNGCGPTILDNDQAICMYWTKCHMWCAYDVFRIKATVGNGQQLKGGAGQISYRDGDIIQNNLSGDTTPHYTLRIDDGAAFYRTFLFSGTKWELRNPESRLVYWVGTASFLTGSVVLFDACDLSQAQQGQPQWGGGGSDTNGRRDFIVLGPAKRVRFNDCFLADQLGIVFQDVNTANVFTMAYGPIVEFESCGMPWPFISGTNDAATAVDANRGLPGRVTLSSGYGRVIARNCFLRDHTPPENMAIDFDYGGRRAGYGEVNVVTKKAELKAGPRAWPTTGVFSRTVRLPEGAIVTGAHLFQPATTSSSATAQRMIAHKRQTITGAVQKPADTEVRITIANHGLQNGDRVFIEGVTGTTEANGLFTVEGVATNTFELTGSTFANAYVSGGNCYKVLIESGAARDDAEHKASMNIASASSRFPFIVSTFEDRKFWLLSTVGNVSKTGGYAYVEYE